MCSLVWRKRGWGGGGRGLCRRYVVIALLPLAPFLHFSFTLPFQFPSTTPSLLSLASPSLPCISFSLLPLPFLVFPHVPCIPYLSLPIRSLSLLSYSTLAF